MAINGISSLLSSLRSQSQAVDRAAERIVSAGSIDVARVPDSDAEALAAESADLELIGGAVQLMVARRAFSAAVRAAQVSNETLAETLEIAGYGVRAA
jgi:hypothetical protein